MLPDTTKPVSSIWKSDSAVPKQQQQQQQQETRFSPKRKLGRVGSAGTRQIQIEPASVVVVLGISTNPSLGGISPSKSIGRRPQGEGRNGRIRNLIISSPIKWGITNKKRRRYIHGQRISTHRSLIDDRARASWFSSRVNDCPLNGKKNSVKLGKEPILPPSTVQGRRRRPTYGRWPCSSFLLSMTFYCQTPRQFGRRHIRTLRSSTVTAINRPKRDSHLPLEMVFLRLRFTIKYRVGFLRSL